MRSLAGQVSIYMKGMKEMLSPGGIFFFCLALMHLRFPLKDV